VDLNGDNALPLEHLLAELALLAVQDLLEALAYPHQVVLR